MRQPAPIRRFRRSPVRRLPTRIRIVRPTAAGSPRGPRRPRNGYRRAIATVLAAVSLTVLLYAAVLVLTAEVELSRDRAIILALFLGLHTFALTILTGDSPWPHLTHFFRGPHDDPPPPS